MNILAKIKKSKNYCWNEWIENYNYKGENVFLRACRHNRVLPKITLVASTALLVITLVAIL